MRTEKTFAVIFLVGLAFKLMHLLGADIIILVSLLTIAILYFPAAFYFFSDKVIKRQNLPLSVVSGLFLSIIPIGILFKVLFWRGAELILLMGSATAPIILVIVYFLKSKATEDLATYYKNMFVRTIVLTVLAISFYLLPTTTQLKYHYWDDKELARLKILRYTNPENAEYKRQLYEYIQKRDSLKFKNLNQ